MKNVKDLKIRILCIITAMISVFTIVPIMCRFYSATVPIEVGSWMIMHIDGIALYTDKDRWWFILIGVLGLVSLLWNLVYGAYALIDGRYRNLTWRIARYGYFYGIAIAIINVASVLSVRDDAELAVWAFAIMVTVVAVLEVVLVLFKDEDTKSKTIKE